MTDDNVLKIIITFIGAFISYCFTCVIKNGTKHELHTTKLSEHDKEIAIIKEQNKHISEKLDYVVLQNNRLEASNKVILRALARKARAIK